MLTGGMSKACHRANRTRANQIIDGPIQPSTFIQQYSAEVDSNSGIGPASETGTGSFRKFLQPTGLCDAAWFPRSLACRSSGETKSAELPTVETDEQIHFLD